MTRGPEWTLSDISKLLNVSQHRLIYLCESHVVNADIEGPSGRGSSRRFSARNILEFAIALKLKDLMLPVAAIAAILYVLRRFEVFVATEMPQFRLPASLRPEGAIDLRIIVRDGRYIYFALMDQTQFVRLYGGLDMLPLAQAHIDPPVFHRQQLPNLGRMMEKISKSRDALSKHLQQVIPHDLATQLLQVHAGRVEGARSALVERVNRVVLQESHLYDADRTAHVPIPPRVRRLIETKSSPETLILVNRLVLQLAYRKELGVSHRSREWLAALSGEPHGSIEPMMLERIIEPFEFGSPEGSRYTRIEVSLNNIARDLPMG